MGNSNRRKLFFYGTSIGALLFLFSEGVFAWQVYALPLGFVLFYFIYEYKFCRIKGISFSLAIIVLMYWFRLVLLPMMAYTGSEDSSVDYNLPIFLTLYEYVVVSVFVFFVNFNRYKIKEKHHIYLCGSIKIYILYGVLAFIVYMLFARDLNLFDFFLKASNTTERSGDIVDFKALIIREIINCGMLFFYLVLVQKWQRKYTQNNRNSSLYCVLFISLLFLSIISGERRTAILYRAFAIVVILIQLFPTQKWKILKTIALGSFLVLTLMTIYKSFYAYMYDSYIAALKDRDVVDALGGQVFDAYFYGIRTIAMNLDFIKTVELSFTNMLYDFLRSIFGLHLLMKDNGFTTTQLYNLSIYGMGQTNGYLFAAISYGYAYFGLLLAPLIPLFNVVVMIGLERLMNRFVSVEMVYIFALIFIRFAFGFESEPMSLINLSTRMFVIYGIFYGVSRLMKGFK